MIISIHPKTRLKEIQQQFCAGFPFLKIRFADKPHKFGEEAGDALWYDENRKVASVSKKALSGQIAIQPWHRTGEIEAAFERQFGLHAQIFRREGEQWIQTAGTDIFSLDEQNAIGKSHEQEQQGKQWIEREKLL